MYNVLLMEEISCTARKNWHFNGQPQLLPPVPQPVQHGCCSDFLCCRHGGFLAGRNKKKSEDHGGP